MFTVKEMFYSLQGEGYHSGRPAVFIRFAGCNMWNGRAKDKAASPCHFCDTDFVGGTRMSVESLVDEAQRLWGNGGKPFVVLTGGEPLLQINFKLLKALKNAGFDIAVETNGSIAIPEQWKELLWVTVSPKTPEFVQRQGNELKLLYPLLNPKSMEGLEFDHFYLQPIDTGTENANTQDALEYCLRNPKWHMSIQTHKILRIR